MNNQANHAASRFEWSLQEEILRLTHQWPQIIASFLAGCILGWGISWLWPTPYQASLDLFISLNISNLQTEPTAAEYRNMYFGNFVEYRDWQMNTLHTLFFTDQIIDPTLSALQESDPYWEKISRPEFKQMLSARWRNVGRCRLSAEHEDAKHASQAVQAWSAVIVKETNLAIDQAQRLRTLEHAIQMIDQKLLTAGDDAPALYPEKAALTEGFFEALEKSLGLSSNLQVQPTTLDDPQTSRMRSSSLLMLISGFLGLILWFVYRIGRLAR